MRSHIQLFSSYSVAAWDIGDGFAMKDVGAFDGVDGTAADACRKVG